MKNRTFCLALLFGASHALSAGVRPRSVTLGPNFDLTIFEIGEPRPIVEAYLTGNSRGAFGAASGPEPADPFGMVLWPGAHLAAKHMLSHPERVAGQRVLVLGAGAGLDALAAARLGASRVLACDINPLTLSLLRDGAAASGVEDGAIVTCECDLSAGKPEALRSCFDVIIASDVLYNERLARAIGRRVGEAIDSAL